jgi:hypothetical protein
VSAPSSNRVQPKNFRNLSNREFRKWGSGGSRSRTNSYTHTGFTLVEQNNSHKQQCMFGAPVAALCPAATELEVEGRGSGELLRGESMVKLAPIRRSRSCRGSCLRYELLLSETMLWSPWRPAACGPRAGLREIGTRVRVRQLCCNWDVRVAPI